MEVKTGDSPAEVMILRGFFQPAREVIEIAAITATRIEEMQVNGTYVHLVEAPGKLGSVCRLQSRIRDEKQAALEVKIKAPFRPGHVVA